MKIKATTTLRTGEPGAYAFIEPGAPINLSNAEAAALIERGFAYQDSSASLKDRDLDDAILDAIDDLVPEAFGKDGKPAVKAIEDIIGQSISAADRDKAWTLYQKLLNDEQ